jgi:hypothetical protein
MAQRELEMDAIRKRAKLDKASLPRSFGLFTPTGHLVMGFASDTDMTTARKALLSAAFPQSKIAAFVSSEVVAKIGKMKQSFSKAAFLFNEFRMMKDHLALARKGGGFLVVYAPSEADTARAVKIAKKFRLRLAHKYNRLTVSRRRF